MLQWILIISSIFPVWLQNRSISAGLKAVLSHTEKSCITDNFQQILEKKNSYQFFSRDLLPLGANKTGLNLIIFHFNTH